MSNKKNRYFLISYGADDFCRGNISFAHDSSFPSNKWLQEQIVNVSARIPTNIAIENIYEFKSKQDFQDYRNTEVANGTD